MKRISLLAALLGLVGFAFTGVASAGTAAPAVTFGSCGFTMNSASKTMSLNADCTTSATITVPNGYTLDGKGHTVTVPGAFSGAVVQNATDGTVMNVQNVKISGDSQPMAENCVRDFNGVAFINASGSITNVTLNNIGLPATGCQLGRAIFVNAPTSGVRQSINIANNTVTNYNKNGIDVRGSVDAKISGNTVTTTASDAIIRNGIVVRLGASAQVWSNTVSGNHTGNPAWVGEPTGLLVMESASVDLTKGPNTLVNNDSPSYVDDGSTVVAKTKHSA